MTTERDFKKLVRARMAETGLNYTAARAELLAQDAALVDAARTDHERAVGRFLVGDRLSSIPVKRKVRAHVLLALVARFEPGRSYTEAEVNENLAAVWEDYAYLRREMVNYGYLQRDSGIYRLPEVPPDRADFYQAELPAWEALWLPRYLAGAPSAD